jgi:hypothetical protein
MIQALRHRIERLPPPLPVWIAGWYRLLRYPQVRRSRAARRRVLRRLGRPVRVAQGPFRGLRYITTAHHSALLPKVLGTYECELGPAIEAICRAGCARIIDIGAAEGYYAVGMAARNPNAEVVAFETNPSARYYLRLLARRNSVADRVRVLGGCDLDALDRALAGGHRSAVICDCEGAEDVLLRPDRIEPLRRALVLVETHDGLETEAGILEGITRRLRERFAPTHAVRLIASRARSHDDLPPGSRLSRADAEEALTENRGRAQWLFMTPRAEARRGARTGAEAVRTRSKDFGGPARAG